MTTYLQGLEELPATIGNSKKLIADDRGSGGGRGDVGRHRAAIYLTSDLFP